VESKQVVVAEVHHRQEVMQLQVAQEKVAMASHHQSPVLRSHMVAVVVEVRDLQVVAVLLVLVAVVQVGCKAVKVIQEQMV
jgi:hypothetical protein